METSFKFSRKLNKYIQVEYITGLDYVPVGYHKYTWCLDKKSARDFIQRFREIETHVKEIIDDKKLGFDYRIIMYKFLSAIDSISTGLDIRSSFSNLELADRFVLSYENSYKEAFTFCKDTLEHVEVEGKFDSYMKDWKRHDKHNELVREYNLPFKSLNLEDFQVDHLKNALEAVEFLNKLIDERKNK
jgi:hypothetical protein